MTVAVPGGGAAQGPRKPLCRWIPEIHVTRLSVSSSLRPKVGLLLLLLVLLVSLCLLGVPLVTKVLVPLVHSGRQPPPGPLGHRLLAAAGGAGSPCLLEAGLADLARWAEGGTRDQLLEAGLGRANCSAAGAGLALHRVFFLPGQLAAEGAVGREGGGLLRMDYRVREARAQVAAWLQHHGQAEHKDWVLGELDNSQLVGIAAATLTLALGKPVDGRFRGPEGEQEARMVRAQGSFLTARLEEGTVVVMEGAGEGLDLCLLLPHGPAPRAPSEAECRRPGLARAALAVTLPQVSLTSRLALAPHLPAVGLDRLVGPAAELRPLSGQRGLHLGELFHLATFRLQDKEGGLPEKEGGQEDGEMLFNRPFGFLVMQRASNRTVMEGTVSAPALH